MIRIHSLWEKLRKNNGADISRSFAVLVLRDISWERNLLQLQSR